MTKNKPHKREHITLQQLVEKERQKSEDRAKAELFKQYSMLDEPKKTTAEVREVEPPAPSPIPKNKPVAKQKKASDTDSLLLTITDLCSLLKLSRSTISRMERENEIPGRVKLGGSVRYHRETVVKWINANMK